MTSAARTPVSAPVLSEAAAAQEPGLTPGLPPPRRALSSPALALLGAFSLSLAVPLAALPLAARSPLWPVLPVRMLHAAEPWVRLDLALPGLLPAIGLAVIAVWLVALGVRATMRPFLDRGFFGRDLLKPNIRHRIPEMMGLPAACLYMLLLFIFIPCRYVEETFPVASAVSTRSSKREMLRELLGVGLGPGDDQNELLHWLTTRTVGSEELKLEALARLQPDGGWTGRMSGRQDFPHHQLATFLSALLSILSAIMLGFLDDVFDIRWRHKLPIPMISCIPLLVVYFAGGGGTHIVVPTLLRARLKLPGLGAGASAAGGAALVDLGALYYVYITLLSIFCTNSINILAGINGVEVGQALVIALSLCANDAMYLDTRAGSPGSRSSVELVQRHLFSLYLLLPFAGTCIGLLWFNRYPSRVFVGDTFCYFAGQVLACVGILGHFSKTLLLFFLPQIFNFLFSCPQLFGLVPIPRHRVPCPVTLPDASIRLAPSSVAWPAGSHASWPAAALLRLAEAAHLARLTRDDAGHITGTTNLTLLNALLVFAGVTGPMASQPPPASSAPPASAFGSRGQATVPAPTGAVIDVEPTSVTGPRIGERGLFRLVMLVQLVGSAAAFAIRHFGAHVFYPAAH